MVQLASSPASPVTITVSSGGKGGGPRSIGLTSPIKRTSLSNNPNSPISSRGNRASSGGRYCSTSKDETEVSSEFVSYTVHIPPTPDRQPMSASLSSHPEGSRIGENPKRSYISGTIFSGGFNSVTRGHVVECSNDQSQMTKSMGMFCGMRGCDGKPLVGKSRLPCECGFKICRDCYEECLGNGGKCPGCKEEYRGEDDQEDEESGSEAEDRALPLPSMSEFKPDKRLSLVKSFKAPNHEFDHTRWLYETKGTYGYGNAVWPKDGFSGAGVQGCDDPPDFGEKTKRPLTRKVGISAAILSPYR